MASSPRADSMARGRQLGLRAVSGLHAAEEKGFHQDWTLNLCRLSLCSSFSPDPVLLFVRDPRSILFEEVPLLFSSTLLLIFLFSLLLYLL